MPIHRRIRKRKYLVRPTRRGFPALIVGTAILIAFGGGSHPLSLGLLSVVLGLTLAARPLDRGIGQAVGLCWLALLAWMLAALVLPAAPVDWRLAADSLDIPISPAVSAQPWVTLETMVSFLAGSALLLLALAYEPDLRQRRQGTQLLASVLLLLAVGAIIAASLGWRLPWADRVHVFSWFPNRNQTALTFACGSVLLFGLALVPWAQRSLASSSAARRRKRPVSKICLASLLALLAGGILLYAVFQSLSRGALIAWAGGMLTLALLHATNMPRGATGLLRFAPALALLLFSFFVFGGGASRDRMLDFITRSSESPGGSVELPADFRWQIYSDTGSMIGDQAWTGAGLGQFRYVFPQYRSVSAAPVGIRHPESDWLWWAAELGLVGLGLIVAGLAALLWRLRGPKGPHADDSSAGDAALDRIYRHIALAALVPFFIHSLVDVGAHRLGTAALAIVLYALARPRQPAIGAPQKLVRQLCRASGLILLVTGLTMLTLDRLRSPLLSAYAPAAAEPLPTAPLQWQPYFRSATQLYPGDRRAALEAFYRARFLVPDSAAIPFREGLFLLREDDHGAAFAAFNSALRRSHDPAETFRQILRRTASKPIHHAHLRDLARGEEELITGYWEAMPSRVFDSEEATTALKGDWLTLPASAQHQILNTLNRRNLSHTALSLFELSATEKQSETWPAAVQALVAEGRGEAALGLLDQNVAHQPLPERTLSEAAFKTLQADALIRGQDAATATRLIQAYLSRERWDDVRRTAERMRKLPGHPPETLYWLARAYAETGHNHEAAQTYAEWLKP